jgi:electron transfer flavoprotein alpha subunit
MSTDAYVVIEHLQGQVADISYVMLAAARVIAQATGGQVVAVLLGHEAEGQAADLAADRLLYVDHPALAEFTPDTYKHVLADMIRDDAPRAVLFGDTSIGAEVAGGLSVRLGLPLVSYCRTVEADGGAVRFVSQVCGGKVMAEGDLPEPTALVTMIPGGYKADEGKAAQAPEVERRPAPEMGEPLVMLERYLEPEVGDVDIARESVLIAVGRGIQREDNMELAEELAELLGGAVCASRPVVDQGWLPTSRLVGKSGKRVGPALYLALGISGAPEHTEGIVDSDTIVAVNTDPAAPIFDVAQFGAEIDMLDLLEVLNEKVREAKGG